MRKPAGVLATFADVRKVFGVQRITRRVRSLAEEALRAEVAVYDQYLRGEVYGFVLTDCATGKVTDSCWGFYGENPWQNGMADHLPPDIRDQVLSYFHNNAA
ncbi:MAG: hypothetical protein ACYDBB_04650 [Armatimonadota bacterium]